MDSPAATQFGEVFARVAVWIALAAYYFSAALQLRAHPSSAGSVLARRLWIVGALACGAHIAGAFAHHHHWSHAAALADTARQTAAVTGLDWGGGIYFNYLFAGVWLADAAWWLSGPESRARRPRWACALVHGFLAFIVFNATVVFGTGAVRWFGLAGFLVLLAVALHRRR